MMDLRDVFLFATGLFTGAVLAWAVMWAAVQDYRKRTVEMIEAYKQASML
jgi:hypothetical protein